MPSKKRKKKVANTDSKERLNQNQEMHSSYDEEPFLNKSLFSAGSTNKILSGFGYAVTFLSLSLVAFIFSIGNQESPFILDSTLIDKIYQYNVNSPYRLYVSNSEKINRIKVEEDPAIRIQMEPGQRPVLMVITTNAFDFSVPHDRIGLNLELFYTGEPLMKFGFLPKGYDFSSAQKEPQGITMTFGYYDTPTSMTTIPSYYDEELLGIDWREAGYFFVMFIATQTTDLTLIKFNFVGKHELG